MKKIILIFICLFPIIVKADYSITNYKVEMTVLENGDLEIIEAFSMDGTYNGFEKNINYKNIYNNYMKSLLSSIENKELYDAQKVVLNEIRAINFDQELKMEDLINNSYLFEKVEEAKKGNYGVYTLSENKNDYIYKIYNPSMMNKDFYIDYTIKNIVISHEDIAELALNFLINNNQFIDNLEIVINVPNNETLLKVWVHGKENKVELIDNQTLKISVNNIEKEDNLDFRLVFDKAIIKEKNKDSNETVLDKIIEIENKFTNDIKDESYEIVKENAYNAVMLVEKTLSKEDYNKSILLVNELEDDDFKTELLLKLIDLESKIERRYTISKVFFTSIMGSLFIGLLIIIYQIYRKYDKNYLKYNEKYYKNIPEYKSYIASFILRKKITRNDLFASIFSLIKNKKILIEKTKKDYKIRIKSTQNLSFSEERLIKFLFNKDEETTFEKMKKRATKHYKSFINKYSNWLNAANYEGNLKEYYEDILYTKIFTISYCVLAIIICTLLKNQPTYFSPFIMIVLFILFIPYFILFNKRTPKGKEEYYKLKAFKRYLKNENINDKLEKYFEYAILFGFEDKFIKNNNYENEDFIKLRQNINECLEIAYDIKREN